MHIPRISVLLLAFAPFISTLPTSSLLSNILGSFNPLTPLSRAVSGPQPTANLITLPLARRVNATGSVNILKLDQARAKAFRERAQKNTNANFAVQTDDVSVSASNQFVAYVVNVQVGDLAYNLIVDTGSSNTWVGAGTPYVPSSSAVPTGDVVSVKYGSGYFIGEEFIDQINMGNGLTFTQSIGTATLSEGFSGVDGILGIGPTALTRGSLKPDTDTDVPTVTESAYNQGKLAQPVVGIFFQPPGQFNAKNGELTFGGVNPSKFTGTLNHVSLTKVDPAKYYVGIDQSITYGNTKTSILSTTAGILDTGTTLVLLATDAFQRYQKCTGGVLDAATGLLTITLAQYSELQSLYFNIEGVQYELIPNAQIWPRALNTVLGGTKDKIYLIVNDLGSPSGNGLDFIDGMTFLERHYMMYDSKNSRVGLATTEYTLATSN